MPGRTGRGVEAHDSVWQFLHPRAVAPRLAVVTSWLDVNYDRFPRKWVCFVISVARDHQNGPSWRKVFVMRALSPPAGQMGLFRNFRRPGPGGSGAVRRTTTRQVAAAVGLDMPPPGLTGTGIRCGIRVSSRRPRRAGGPADPCLAAPV